MTELVQVVCKDKAGFIRTYREFEVIMQGDYEEVLEYINEHFNELHVSRIEIARMTLD